MSRDSREEKSDSESTRPQKLKQYSKCETTTHREACVRLEYFRSIENSLSIEVIGEDCLYECELLWKILFDSSDCVTGTLDGRNVVVKVHRGVQVYLPEGCRIEDIENKKSPWRISRIAAPVSAPMYGYVWMAGGAILQ
jgi:hypothetical protein